MGNERNERRACRGNCAGTKRTPSLRQPHKRILFSRTFASDRSVGRSVKPPLHAVLFPAFPIRASTEPPDGRCSFFSPSFLSLSLTYSAAKPSILRASAMGCILLLSTGLGRRGFGLATLSAAGFYWLIQNPIFFHAMQASCSLSDRVSELLTSPLPSSTGSRAAPNCRRSAPHATRFPLLSIVSDTFSDFWLPRRSPRFPRNLEFFRFWFRCWTAFAGGIRRKFIRCSDRRVRAFSRCTERSRRIHSSRNIHRN